jgi:hypothetical protein
MGTTFKKLQDVMFSWLFVAFCQELCELRALDVAYGLRGFMRQSNFLC